MSDTQNSPMPDGRNSTMIKKVRNDMQKYADLRGKDDQHHQLAVSKQMVRNEVDCALKDHLRVASRPELPQVTTVMNLTDSKKFANSANRNRLNFTAL